MTTECSGKNRTGGPCSATVPDGGRWCQWHDPAREADRAEWRRKGGANRSNRARARKQLAEQVMSIDDLDALLCLAIKKVSVGLMEPGIGSAMATIAKTVVGIRTASELEARIDALEAMQPAHRRYGA